MKTEDKSVGIRLERGLYEKAMKAKQEALEKHIPAAYATQSWFSMLVDLGLSRLEKKKEGDGE